MLVTGKSGSLAATLLSWGFLKWDDRGVVINACGKTAAEKPMFCRVLESKRCVVSTSGFFEWRHEGGRKKEKYLFTLPESLVLYLAGLWAEFRRSGKPVCRAYVVLTKALNESISSYHDRMPLILHREDICAGWAMTGMPEIMYSDRVWIYCKRRVLKTRHSAAQYGIHIRKLSDGSSPFLFM